MGEKGHLLLYIMSYITVANTNDFLLYFIYEELINFMSTDVHQSVKVGTHFQERILQEWSFLNEVYEMKFMKWALAHFIKWTQV